ncbi:MAG TPA: LptA/OstA family protein [Gammaproteobacteria bacterium]
MLTSLPRLAALAAAFVVCSVPAAQEGDALAPNDSSPFDSLEADSFSLDRQSELVVFEGLRARHGRLSLQADRAVATGVDLDSRWELTGNVRIAVDTALLEADSATFKFDDRELVLAELHGDPAAFTDSSPERDEEARGGASSLSYDYREQTLRLAGNAWLSIGQNEIRGCDLMYDFQRGRVTSGSSACSERFSITIVPPAEDAASDPARSP